MPAANVVAPGRAQSLPLPPEFVQPQDGAAKQDCERQAVKRWLARYGPRCAALRPAYLGDDLYACQPVCQAMLNADGDFLLTCKQPSHKTLYEYLDGIRPPTRRRTAARGAKRRIHRYRWMTGLPIRDGDNALVTWRDVAMHRYGEPDDAAPALRVTAAAGDVAGQCAHREGRVAAPTKPKPAYASQEAAHRIPASRRGRGCDGGGEDCD